MQMNGKSWGCYTGKFEINTLILSMIENKQKIIKLFGGPFLYLYDYYLQKYNNSHKRHLRCKTFSWSRCTYNYDIFDFKDVNWAFSAIQSITLPLLITLIWLNQFSPYRSWPTDDNNFLLFCFLLFVFSFLSIERIWSEHEHDDKS